MRRYQPGVPQLAQVVRDEVLGLADQAGQFVHHPIAARQLGQQPPANRMTGEAQELRRRQRFGEC